MEQALNVSCIIYGKKPAISGEFKISDVYKALEEAQFDVSQTRTHFADSNYLALHPTSADEFIKFTNVDDIKYQKLSFDCDDFALLLAGLSRYWFRQEVAKLDGGCPVAYVTVPKHAFNVVFARDNPIAPLQAIPYEPQTGKRKKIKPRKLKFILM